MARVRQRKRPRVVKPAEEREQEILDAAFRLFHEKGFAETAVGDIAAGAGVATGTVYLYFPSKEHVLLAIHEEFDRGLESRFIEIAAGFIERQEAGETVDSRQVIDRIVDALFAYVLERREVCEVICRNTPSPELMPKVLEAERGFVGFLTRAFEEGTSAGRMHTSDPEMTAYLVKAAISYTLAFAVTYGEPPDVDRLAAQAKEVLHKALAPVASVKGARSTRGAR
jgi:AcrR family transcriptional regulator